MSYMNKPLFKDIALLLTAATLMGGMALAPSANGIASTLKANVQTAYDRYVPQQDLHIPNLPTIGQAFDVIGRGNI